MVEIDLQQCDEVYQLGVVYKVSQLSCLHSLAVSATPIHKFGSIPNLSVQMCTACLFV
jgi:hypothetical protein